MAIAIVTNTLHDHIRWYRSIVENSLPAIAPIIQQGEGRCWKKNGRRTKYDANVVDGMLRIV